MKPFKYALVLLTLCITYSFAANYVVSGYAYLENQTDHSGIKVKYNAISPSAISDSATTGNNGFYSISLKIGTYRVEYQKEGYITRAIQNFFLSSDTVLPNVTLRSGTVVEIAGSISGILTNDHVYKVIGNLTIPDINSLTIEPGTILMFDGNYSLNCYGPITAIGAEQDSIFFTSAQPSPAPGDWGKVYVNYNDNDSTNIANQFNYCVFEYGEGDNSQLEIHYSIASIKNCSFRNSGRGDLRLDHSYGVIDHSHFSGGSSNYWNVYNYYSTALYTKNSLTNFNNGFDVYGSESDVEVKNMSFINGHSHALYFYNWAKGLIDSCRFESIDDNWTVYIRDHCLVTFQNNELIDVASWNILEASYNSHVNIINNYIEGNICYREYYNNSHNQSFPPQISRNVIVKNPQDCCYEGLQIENNDRLIEAHHNTIYGFTGGHRGIYLRDNDSLSIHSNIIYGNDNGIHSYNNGYMDYSYNCFYANSNLTQENDFPQGFGQVVTTNTNGDPSDIYSNIFLNPQFEDYSSNDFTLQITSPCINAGSPTYTDDDGTVSDMGAKPHFFPFLVEHTPLNSTNDTNGPYTVIAEIKPTKNQSITNTLHYKTTPDGFFAGNGENTALEFSGSNSGDRVEIPYNDEYNFTNMITVEAWIKPSSTGHAYILSNRGDNGTEGFLLAYDDWDRRIRWHIWTNNSSNSWDGSTYLNANQWYHVAATYDGYHAKLYINGALDGNWDWQCSGTINNSYDGITIGYRRHHAQEWNGIIDEVRIWNTVRTSVDINNNMHRELHGNEPGLVGYWRFDERSGTTATDQSNNHNDGSIVGATYTTDAPSLLPTVEFNEADWTSATMNNTTGDNYSADIPGRSLNTTIDYYIQVTDGSDTLTSPYHVPYEFHRFNVSLFESTVSFNATPQNDGSIGLVWGTPTVIDGSLYRYNLYFDTAPNVEISPANLLASLGTDKNSYTHSNLIEGTTYYYKITGILDDGNDTEGIIANEISAISDNSTLMLAHGIVQIENATDHSGVKILFIPETETGTLDSVFSNSSGNFSIILPVSIYSVDIAKAGCVPVHIPSLFFIGNYDFGIVELLIRQTQELSGSIKDTLTSDIYYIVTGNLTISSNDTLWIEPGTYIAFNGYYRIDANGPIFSSGAEGDSVYFTSNAFQPATGDWEYIRLMNNAHESRFEYCVFEYGDGYDEWYGSGVLRIEVSNILIDHCRFSNNHRGALSFYGTNCSKNVIQNSTFSFNWYNKNNDGGILNIRHWNDAGDEQIINNKFYNNYGRDIAIYECYKGLVISNNYFESDNDYDNTAIITHYTKPLIITNNIFVKRSSIRIYYDCYGIIEGNSVIHSANWDQGLYVYQSCITVTNNTFQNCRDGIYYENNKQFNDNILYPQKISYNTIINSYESGIEIGNNNNNIEVSNNTLVNADRDRNNGSDGAAIYLRNNTAKVTLHSNVITDSRYACYLNNTSNVDFHNNDFWNNAYLLSGSGYPSGLGMITSQNYNGSPCDIYFNIFLDPKFTDPNNGDYSLLSSSPLINAGYILNTDVDGTIADIGAHPCNFGFIPQNLVVDSTGNGWVALSWEITETDSLNGYIPYYKLSSSSTWTSSDNVTTKSTTISGLTNNMNYDFCAAAVYPSRVSNLSKKITTKPGVAAMEISPKYFVVFQQVGETTVKEFTVTNNGTKDLSFTINPGIDYGTVTFTKANYADWNLPENQDRITDNVWITRQNSQGIYNAVTENSWSGCGPTGTEWAWGYTKGVSPGDYKCWQDVARYCPAGNVDDCCTNENVMSLHLTEENLYFDITWHSWTCCNNGGGFSYTRDHKNIFFLKPTSGIISPGGSYAYKDTLIGDRQEIISSIFKISSNGPDNLIDSVSVLKITGTFTTLQPQNFTRVDNTSKIFYVVVDKGEIDGENLQTGDEVGIFDGELCVGAGGFNGSFPMIINCYGADGGSPGFTTGDSIIIKLYDASKARDATVSEVNYSFGNGHFVDGGFIKASLQGSIYQTIEIPLTVNRFNLISSYLYPRYPSASQIFSSVAGLKIAYEDNGSAYIPQYNINTIGDLDITEGYHLFVETSDCNLTVSGLEIDPVDFPLVLQKGCFNSIGYLLSQPQAVTIVFTEIADQIEIVQDDEGGVWIPGLGINTLGNLQPLSGYQVFTNASTDLTFAYQQGEQGFAKPTLAESVPKQVQSTHFGATATGLPYTIVINSVLMDHHPLEDSAEVAVFCGELCVGTIVWQKAQKNVLTAWGGNEELGVNGYRAGEPMRFRAYSKRFQTEFELDGYFANQEQAVFEGAAYALANLSGEPGLIPERYALYQNYPNPFNSRTVIPYDVPQEAEVSIVIYDILGREVARLVNHQIHQPGKYRYEWAGRNQNGIAISSGIYFVRMISKDYQKVQKLVLLK